MFTGYCYQTWSLHPASIQYTDGSSRSFVGHPLTGSASRPAPSPHLQSGPDYADLEGSEAIREQHLSEAMPGRRTVSDYAILTTAHSSQSMCIFLPYSATIHPLSDFPAKVLFLRDLLWYSQNPSVWFSHTPEAASSRGMVSYVRKLWRCFSMLDI